MRIHHIKDISDYYGIIKSLSIKKGFCSDDIHAKTIEGVLGYCEKRDLWYLSNCKEAMQKLIDRGSKSRSYLFRLSF